MFGGVASSYRPPRDCNRRDRKRSQRNSGDRNTGARRACRCRSRPRRHCCLVERVQLDLALGDKADMRSPGVGIALPEPEKYAAVPSEALEVGMPLGAILAVVIEGMHDAERLESLPIKGNRSIEILDGYNDVVEHEFTSFVDVLVAFPCECNAHSDRAGEPSPWIRLVAFAESWRLRGSGRRTARWRTYNLQTPLP